MTDAQKILTIEDFVEFAVRRLGIEKAPELKFASNRDWSVERHSFGQYDPNGNTLTVYINNRNMADVLRTLGHELVHHRQNELGKIQNDSGKTGSEIENEANALAGVLMRDYGRINDTIYEAIIPSLKQIYEAEKSGRIQIYCDMDGVLCDFDSRFEHFYGVPPREYANEKGQKAMEEAVDKVGVTYWSKMPWLKGGKELWNKISKYNPKILTSPGKFIHAREGKLIWIKENLNPQPQDIMFANTGKKFEAIKDKTPQEIRNSMLIDDYYPNLAPWKEIGGIAIMYKSYDQVSAILDKFRLIEAKDITISRTGFNKKAEQFFDKLSPKDVIALRSWTVNLDNPADLIDPELIPRRDARRYIYTAPNITGVSQEFIKSLVGNEPFNVYRAYEKDSPGFGLKSYTISKRIADDFNQYGWKKISTREITYKDVIAVPSIAFKDWEDSGPYLSEYEIVIKA